MIGSDLKGPVKSNIFRDRLHPEGESQASEKREEDNMNCGEKLLGGGESTCILQSKGILGHNCGAPTRQRSRYIQTIPGKLLQGRHSKETGFGEIKHLRPPGFAKLQHTPATLDFCPDKTHLRDHGTSQVHIVFKK